MDRNVKVWITYLLLRQRIKKNIFFIMSFFMIQDLSFSSFTENAFLELFCFQSNDVNRAEFDEFVADKLNGR